MINNTYISNIGNLVRVFNYAIMDVLKRLPALRAGWGRVPYDHTFGASTCVHPQKKFVTKEKMSTACFKPWTSGLSQPDVITA